MTQRLLIVALVVFLGMIVLSRRENDVDALPADRVALAAADSVAAPPPAPRRQPLGPLPAAYETVQGGGTGAIDLRARLAIRRRIEREGDRVYLDSLLAQTDSTVVRWPDRTARTLTVRFQPDATVPAGTVAAARDGLQRWSGNQSGWSLRETRDTAEVADIEVTWVEMLSQEAEFGVTELNWEPSGAARSARIRLAQFTNPDRDAIPAEVMSRVAAHEFGHALGLPHSSDQRDLMHPSSPVSGPSRRDQATLMLLYAVPPGSLRTP